VANFATTPKLIEVATGKIIYSKNLSATTTSAGCDDRSLPQGEKELIDKVKGSIKAQFRKDVAPYYVTEEIKIMDATDGIEAKEAKDKLKDGIEYADKGRMDTACERWGSARILAPSSFSILYNLGVCAESRGDAEAARSLYMQADKILGKPDDDITLALSRVSETLKNRKKLEEQLKGK
jgi:tetratricopeptide (TPR) repeat protein